MANFTKLLFCKKNNIILASNFFMQLFKQSIELFQHKLWY